MGAAKTFDEVMKNQTVVHRARITGQVTAHITQARDRNQRSQFLCLILHDEATGRFIVFKLSTFRKVAKWFARKGFGKARRLTTVEKMMMDFRDWLIER
jgi:hypothetical protein